MAFIRPALLIPVTFVYQGAVDNITDYPLGQFHFDGEIFYIEVDMHDANNTFDETDLTFKAGSTTLDVVTVAAQAGSPALTSVDQDSITEATVNADDACTCTMEDVSTGADLGFSVTFWINPTDFANG